MALVFKGPCQAHAVQDMQGGSSQLLAVTCLLHTDLASNQGPVSKSNVFT